MWCPQNDTEDAQVIGNCWNVEGFQSKKGSEMVCGVLNRVASSSYMTSGSEEVLAFLQATNISRNLNFLHRFHQIQFGLERIS